MEDIIVISRLGWVLWTIGIGVAGYLFGLFAARYEAWRKANDKNT